MFEHITYNELVKRMIDRTLSYNKNVDSREGSLLFLAEAPAAVELQSLYIALDTVLRETFADTVSIAAQGIAGINTCGNTVNFFRQSS